MSSGNIQEQAYGALKEALYEAKVNPGELVVIGCSTSEVLGKRIGSSTSLEVAEQLYAGWHKAADEYSVDLAFQCCEHLNRALIVHKAVALRFQLDCVNVIPVPKAGGAMASYAYQAMSEAVVVENLKQVATAGLDVGDTLIGMHLKPVVVPLRLTIKQIGDAHLVAARTRAKLIGGQRAVYDLATAKEQLQQAGFKPL